MRSLLIAALVAGAATIPVGSVVSSTSDQISSAIDRLLASFNYSSSQSSENSIYATEIVERGDIITTVQAAGTLNAVTMVDVGSQISGKVKELYADFNSQVTAGEVIARVEPEMYEAKVSQAEAEVEMAEAQVSVQEGLMRQMQAELETAQARLSSADAEIRDAEVARDSALQEVERRRSLAERKVISFEQLERAESAYRSAEAQVAAAVADKRSRAAEVRAAEAMQLVGDAQLIAAKAQLKQRKAVLRQSRIDLDRTYIRAPVTGTVVDRAVSGGQTLAASLQSPVLFTIAQDLSQMQIEASVVEADISRFRPGQPVTFTVDAYPERTFVGEVKQIRKSPQMIQNVVTYVVIVTAGNPDELLLPGMTANLRVVVAERKDVLKVSNAALRFRPKNLTAGDAGKTGGPEPVTVAEVYVPGPTGAPEAVELRTGISDGRMSEVLSGDLREGRAVITGLTSGSGDEGDSSSVTVRFRLW